jgi:hypothetical protein
MHRSAAVIAIVLGVWLFLSAFLWPHEPAQQTNTWISGVLCALFALIALSAPRVQYLNTALAIWIFISSWAIPASPLGGTLWNNTLVAVVLFILSLIPLGPLPRARQA